MVDEGLDAEAPEDDEDKNDPIYTLDLTVRH
jgi:hypothetical protein